MKSESTSLVLPSMPVIHPKPTKTEVLNAMVVRAKIKHDAENESRKTRQAALDKKIRQLALKEFKSKAFKGEPKLDLLYYVEDQRKRVDLEFSVQTEEITALMIEHSSLGRIAWDERVVRQAIKDQLDGRISCRLLDDPASVKAIDAMLEQWSL